MKRITDAQQPEFQRKQREIYEPLGSELIKLLPQSWYSAVLELEPGSEGVAHTIYNEDG